MQNHATLRNALRKRNYELPSVRNAMQSSATMRNSLGVNYKSAALLDCLGAQNYKIHALRAATLYFLASGKVPSFRSLA